VFKALHKVTGKIVAVKIIPMANENTKDDENLKKEINILR